MSYKEMKVLAKSLSTYQKPRLTLFGNAVYLVKSGKVNQRLDGGNNRTKQYNKKNNSNKNNS